MTSVLSLTTLLSFFSLMFKLSVRMSIIRKKIKKLSNCSFTGKTCHSQTKKRRQTKPKKLMPRNLRLGSTGTFTRSMFTLQELRLTIPWRGTRCTPGPRSRTRGSCPLWRFTTTPQPRYSPIRYLMENRLLFVLNNCFTMKNVA